jgi:hypothetical protein
MTSELVCPGCGDGAQLFALERVIAHYPARYVEDGGEYRWPQYAGTPAVPATSKPVSTGVVLCGRCGRQCLAGELLQGR